MFYIRYAAQSITSLTTLFAKKNKSNHAFLNLMIDLWLLLLE